VRQKGARISIEIYRGIEIYRVKRDVNLARVTPACHQCDFCRGRSYTRRVSVFLGMKTMTDSVNSQILVHRDDNRELYRWEPAAAKKPIVVIILLKMHIVKYAIYNYDIMPWMKRCRMTSTPTNCHGLKQST